MIGASEANETAELFAAVAEKTRLQILHHLSGGPMNVGRLAKLVGIPIVNMSHHLGVMRLSGVLDDNKKGRQVIYSIKKKLHAPSDDEHGLVLHFGRYIVRVRRNPTDIPAPPPARKRKRKAPA